MTANAPPNPPIALLMGVSGCGKTTVGTGLAQRTGWPFIDGDMLHSSASVAKMHAGIPLTDEDRWPWLQRVAEVIAEWHAVGSPGIVGCSALKRSYRDLLRSGDPDLRVVYLKGDRALLEQRLRRRSGHFFPAALLNAQLSDLEEPSPDERPVVVLIGQSPDETVNMIFEALNG